MANTSEKQAYIARVAATLKGKSARGLFPSVIIAQAALESAWGKSLLSAQYNNHFGMKKGTLGTDYGGWSGGQTVTLKTGEVINGQSCTVNGEFRVYPSLAASVADHNGLFYKLSRYSAVCKATSPKAQIQAIKDGGYATSINYVEKVMSVINSNNLTRFDTPEFGYGSKTASAQGEANGADSDDEPPSANPVMAVVESVIDGDIATADEESDRAARLKKTIVVASVVVAVLIAAIVAIVVLRRRKK